MRVPVHQQYRHQASAWTDASGDIRGLGAVLACNGSLWYTSLVAPEQIMEQLMPRDNQQIGFLEMLAILLLGATFPDILARSAVTVFVDNNGVLGSVIRGSSKASEINLAVGRWWLQAAKLDCAPYFARVTSAANISDGPSRMDFALMTELHATRRAPVLPEWLGEMWSLPELHRELEDKPHGKCF